MIQYIKDKLKDVMTTFHMLENCKLKHAKNWPNLFVNYQNKETWNRIW